MLPFWKQACRQVAEGCIACGLCRKECEYLQRFGLPLEQAEKALADSLALSQVFSCSLCGLCTAVCPQEIDPAAMFLSLRREAVARGRGIFSEHQRLIRYENWGRSRAFSWVGLPPDCKTVFFPGCALAGSRPHRVLQVVATLRQSEPSLGVILDCCSKPLLDLGRAETFCRSFNHLPEMFRQRNITKVVVACPSCFTTFSEFVQGVKVQTIYELLAEAESMPPQLLKGKVTVHDPCAVRNQEQIHTAARTLITRTGLSVAEMKHHQRTTYCCGEGGAVGFLHKSFARNWSEKRIRESAGNTMITYCAGCTNTLSPMGPIIHILDLMFDGENSMRGKIRVARSPFTWVNRLWLKQKLRKLMAPSSSGSATENCTTDRPRARPLYSGTGLVNRKRRRKAEQMYGRYRRAFQEIGEMRAETALLSHLRERIVSVDIRDREEQNVSMLPGAMTESEFLADPEKFNGCNVLCYCTIGYRSGLFVKQHGNRFPFLRNLYGGLLLWLHAGGSLEHGGEKTCRVHVYGPRWALQPVGYLPVFKVGPTP